MNYKLIKLVALLLVLISMIGISAAAFETISVNYDGTNIVTEVGELQEDKYYVLRYYPPGTFACNTGGSTDSCEAEIAADPDNAAMILGTEWCTGDDPITDQSKCQILFESNHTEAFAPTVDGTWAIGLFHGGQGGDSITSYKVNTKINVPIPEFPTIALPMLSILGLMFIMSRKRK